MEYNSAQAVRKVIIDRVMAGVYQQGGQLPVTTELARELGVHRNTVAKAYQLLASEGLVTSRRGRGTFVTRSIDRGSQQDLRQSLHDSLEQNVIHARRIGLTKDELFSTFRELIDAAYDGRSARGAFVECNMPDIQAHIDDIEAMTRVRLEPLPLSRALSQIEQLADQYDVVFTSLFHVKELTDALSGLSPQLKVIGLHTVPDEQSLTKLAAIQPESSIGIVTSNEDSAHRLENLVQIYTEGRTHIVSSPTNAELENLAEKVDVVVCTRSHEPVVRASNVRVPTIALPFHVSSQSSVRVTENMLPNYQSQESRDPSSVDAKRRASDWDTTEMGTDGRGNE